MLNPKDYRGRIRAQDIVYKNCGILGFGKQKAENSGLCGPGTVLNEDNICVVDPKRVCGRNMVWREYPDVISNPKGHLGWYMGGECEVPSTELCFRKSAELHPGDSVEDPVTGISVKCLRDP